MQHLQLQKHEGLALQMQHLYIVPSCAYHTYVVIFGMDLLQSVYFQCMSAEHMIGHLLRRIDKKKKVVPFFSGTSQFNAYFYT